MVIGKSAMAGTLEPGEGLEVNVSSSVLNQYGRQIKATVLETLERLDVCSGKVTIIDKGALNCTLKARVECAVFRIQHSLTAVLCPAVVNLLPM